MNKENETKSNEFEQIAETIEEKAEDTQQEEKVPEKKTRRSGKELLLDGRFRTDKPKRDKRIPIGSRNRLQFDTRPGFRRRFFNDVDDRIKQAEAGGYRVVTEVAEGGDKSAGADSQLASPVVKAVGGGISAVLMEIPEELYAEDQRKKQELVDKGEEDIVRSGTTQQGIKNGLAVTGDGSYGTGIQIQR